MTPYWTLDGPRSCTLYHGDCLEVLRAMPADSIHTVMTSPPYFALRSYLPKDHPLKALEIGSEPTPEAFVQTMVDVFREVRRVLRPDGVCWINLGDSMSAGGRKGHGTRIGHKQETNTGTLIAKDIPRPVGLPGGNLMNIPHRVAEALRQDGWIWRQTIVWAKKSPMPESVGGCRWVRCRVKAGGGWTKETHPSANPDSFGREGVFGSCNGTKQREDAAQWSPCPGCEKCIPNNGYVLRRGAGRCTTAHEYLFLMTKTGRYFWDSCASAERSVSDHPSGNGFKRDARLTYNGRGQDEQWNGQQRNPRSVWTISSEPTKVRHFATYPSELVRRCLASAPTKVCPHCGAPWAPVVECERVATRPGTESKVYGAMNPESPYMDHAAIGNCDPQRHCTVTIASEYRPTCSCPAHDPIGGVVLDPFCGIGTTGQTALHIGMQFIGIDLNQEYLEHSKVRLLEPPRWWLRQQKKPKKRRRQSKSDQRMLFQ